MPGQFGHVPPLIGLKQGCGEHACPNRWKESVERAVITHNA